ncbi:MmcQ/YjbR family DNA-binding protein [Paenibacillus sedimenti]|uniref:MmcQ/YjbR family DNA-binding protein n=1 Tax=Paenibacillus sedimenti TaxID=2770274 RepID=A0A926KTT3_9BACL|nr:MmcQ/YjbR family DNA-binding protein [Paenibacillus sedimenti]MBD0382103.1 MmcQ/YjbR family DNA-binding protein [Paenibacillus sedimenti]
MTHEFKSAKGLELLDKVRSFCMKLPQVEEKVDGFGHTTFRVKDKPFVMMGENDGQPSMALKTNLTTQEFLLQQEGTAYSKTAYIGHHGWVSIQDTAWVAWSEIEDLMVEGYARTAPKKLVAELMASRPVY